MRARLSGASGKRLPEQVRTLERLCQAVSKEGLELPELLIGRAPLPGRAAKLGRRGAGGLAARGPRTGLGMEATLLSCVLALL